MTCAHLFIYWDYTGLAVGTYLRSEQRPAVNELLFVRRRHVLSSIEGVEAVPRRLDRVDELHCSVVVPRCRRQSWRRQY